MATMVLPVLAGLAWIVQSTSGSVHWTYKGDHGSSHWKEFFKDCGKDRQSPINIRDPSFDIDSTSDLGRIEFINYNSRSLGMELKNNGHAAQVDITSGSAFIQGPGLAWNAAYRLAQFHFHWGGDSTRGSEHLLNGKAFPAELHFVHYNTGFNDLSSAASKEYTGLAVLGVFLEVGEEDNPAYDAIINALKDVTLPGKPVEIDSIVLQTLLPENTDSFYRYQGSLTTPPCYQSVQWTVFKSPVYLSEAQLAQFRTLETSEGEPLVDNYRPAQKLGFRPVKSQG